MSFETVNLAEYSEVEGKLTSTGGRDNRKKKGTVESL
jgi:hypothetical protein